MMHRLTGIGAAAAALALLIVSYAFAFEVPVNDGFVTDDAGLLSQDEEALLEDNLTQYRAATSNEVAVVIVKNLSGAVAADAAVEIGRRWGVGTEKDNGILMLISYEDREIWIATGYGLEGAVPDLVAHGIAERDMAPHFREGNYHEGIAAGIDALKKHIGGEYTAERYEETQNADGIWPWLFFFVFICFNWLAALFARTKSWWLGGIFGALFGIILTALYAWWVSIPILTLLGLLFDYIVSKGGGRGPRGGFHGGGWGGGMRGGGGGGFGGFGGGSFGGGGGGSKW